MNLRDLIETKRSPTSVLRGNQVIPMNIQQIILNAKQECTIDGLEYPCKEGDTSRSSKKCDVMLFLLRTAIFNPDHTLYFKGTAYKIHKSYSRFAHTSKMPYNKLFLIKQN